MISQVFTQLLKEMNKDKVDLEPFHYPITFLLLIGYVEVYFHLSYRQTKEGIAQRHAKGKVLPFIPDYSTIGRRINKLDIKIKDMTDSKYKGFKDKYIIIAMGSSSIT